MSELTQDNRVQTSLPRCIYKPSVITPLLLCLVFAIGCSTNTGTPVGVLSFADQAASSELRQLEDRRHRLSSSASARQQTIAVLNQNLYQQESTLRKYNSEVQQYLMQHKMAVAAIASTAGGGAVALDPNNEFSDDAQALAGAVGVIAGIYAIANFQEVSQVADQMVQADAHVKNLKGQIAATKARISTETRQLESENAEIEEIASQLAAVRSKAS